MQVIRKAGGVNGPLHARLHTTAACAAVLQLQLPCLQVLNKPDYWPQMRNVRCLGVYRRNLGEPSKLGHQVTVHQLVDCPGRRPVSTSTSVAAAAAVRQQLCTLTEAILKSRR
jgi:hypothetical protein